jgi:hypothetical protein
MTTQEAVRRLNLYIESTWVAGGDPEAALAALEVLEKDGERCPSCEGAGTTAPADECPCRKALHRISEALGIAILGLPGPKINWNQEIGLLYTTLSTPCPCQQLCAERDEMHRRLKVAIQFWKDMQIDRDRFRERAEKAEAERDKWLEENERLKEEVSGGLRAYNSVVATRDTAIRTRDLAQEASTRDLEAKRTAEAGLKRWLALLVAWQPKIECNHGRSPDACFECQTILQRLEALR